MAPYTTLDTTLGVDLTAIPRLQELYEMDEAFMWYEFVARPYLFHVSFRSDYDGYKDSIACFDGVD